MLSPPPLWDSFSSDGFGSGGYSSVTPLAGMTNRGGTLKGSITDPVTYSFPPGLASGTFILTAIWAGDGTSAQFLDTGGSSSSSFATFNCTQDQIWINGSDTELSTNILAEESGDIIGAQGANTRACIVVIIRLTITAPGAYVQMNTSANLWSFIGEIDNSLTVVQVDPAFTN